MKWASSRSPLEKASQKAFSEMIFNYVILFSIVSCHAILDTPTSRTTGTSMSFTGNGVKIANFPVLGSQYAGCLDSTAVKPKETFLQGGKLSVSWKVTIPEMNDAIKQAVALTSKSYCWRTLHGHESAIKSLDFFEDVIISGDIRGYIMVWHKGSGNCLNVLGLNPRVGQLVQIGIDEETDSQRKIHDTILKEPIAEIQFSGKLAFSNWLGHRLLIATLSGYAFLSKPISLI